MEGLGAAAPIQAVGGGREVAQFYRLMRLNYLGVLPPIVLTMLQKIWRRVGQAAVPSRRPYTGKTELKVVVD